MLCFLDQVHVGLASPQNVAQEDLELQRLDEELVLLPPERVCLHR